MKDELWLKAAKARRSGSMRVNRGGGGARGGVASTFGGSWLHWQGAQSLWTGSPSHTWLCSVVEKPVRAPKHTNRRRGNTCRTGKKRMSFLISGMRFSLQESKDQNSQKRPKGIANSRAIRAQFSV